jgi:glutamate-1-semialdehyde aminotransferase
MDGMDRILTDADLPHVVTGAPTMFSLFIGGDEMPMDFRGYLKGDGDLYEAIAMELIERGVQPDSDGREPWFLCYALSEEDVAETLTVFEESVKAVKA